MARKRFSEEDIISLLRQIELELAAGSDVPTACRSAGISDATYYNWRKRYGGMGKRLYELAHGRDQRRVDPGHGAKSISSETTFNDDISDLDALIGHLWRLAVRTSDRAKAKELSGHTVTLKLKTADFQTLTRQQACEPATNLADTIHELSEPLLRKIADRGPFRLIGVGLSGLVQADDRPPAPSLFADQGAVRAEAEKATDAIRARFGKDAILRGRALR